MAFTLYHADQMPRVEVQDLEVDTELRRIRARVPLGDMFSYSTQLRSLTQGRGNFALEPAGYAPVGTARLALSAL